MNTTILPHAMSTDEFVVQIHDDYDNSPTDAAEHLSPYMLGVQDAEQGQLCVPEIYYARKAHMLEYAEGYESVAGKTLLSMDLLHPLESAAYWRGAQDYDHKRYAPPPASEGQEVYAAYLRGYNDTWAAQTGRKLVR